MAWQPPEESFDDTKKSQWSPPEESFDDAKKPQWSPPEESFDDSITKIEDVNKLKEIQSTGQKLTDKQQRILFKADDERSFLDKVSGAAGAFIPAAADIIGQTATGAVELANKAVIQPAALALTGGYNRLDSEEAKKVFKEREEAIRSLGVGVAKDIEETANAAVRFGMFGSATTDKLLGKSDEERFRAWQDRQTMRQLEAQEIEQNPDRVAALLSQNPLIQGYVENEAKKMGMSPEQVEKVKQDYIQTMLDQGLTKDQINQNISALGEFVSPVAIPGGGRLSGAVLKPLSKVTAPVFNKATDLTARGISKLAGGTEFAANKVLQGTELLQTGARKIGEYAINDPDTWIKGTVNTAIMPVVGVAKPVSATARVIKDITKQVDVGGTAGRMGMVERAGKAVDSSDLTKKLFGAQGKGGVTRAKLADWTIRQSNALIQPGINAGAMNVVMGLPDIETAEDLGFSAGTGFGIGSLAGSRAIDRVSGLVDPRTTMAEKINNFVTPDPAAYRRDEDADIKRFMAQATPDIQQNITDIADIEKRKAAVDATIASLEKSRDAQIDPEDAAFKQKQIDGFLKQKEALSKATPETQAEALRQTQLAFIDAYDLAQSTGGVAGLRGVNIAVLDPNNADQFFRDLYGDSLKQAETTINLLTGIPSLTETDSQKLIEARQLIQKFQNDVEGAKSARGFAIQEDNTDPNSKDFVPPHLRRINQQGATAVINADLIKHLSSQGFNIRHTLQHEVQHAVQQFSEVNKMLAPLRGQLFDQKIKNDDGTTEVYQQGIYSDEDLNRYATQYAKLMSPSDNGASFYAQFGGDSEKMRAYIKDEILAETAAATGEYAGGTRASLDDVGRNVMDWLEVKTKSGRLKQLKEALRRNGVIFDNIGAVSSVLDAQMSPETLAMVRQYQRGLKDFDGTMTVQQSRESDEPDIPLTKVLGSIALQNKYKHADFFEKEQIIKATAPDGSVTEIVVPAGAKIDQFVDVYRTQGGQLVDADGNVVTLGPEITFGSMPDGTTFETDTRIARKSNGSPIILTNREMKARARKRTELIQAAIDSAKDDGSGVRLSDTGNGNYRGVMSPAQIEAFMALPNEVISPNLKRMTKFFNELMARNDGTRVVMEYQAALLNGRYKALSPKIRDEIPIGFQLTKDGNFALTTISVSRLYDKMQAWADKKPANLQLWNGDTGAFWDSLTKLLDNHSRGEKGEIGLHPDAYIAEKMKNKINDLFNAYNAETKQANPDRSTLPRARGKDNLDIVIRSRRLDRINNFEESPSQKLPINYGYLTTNYMPAVNPMAAPMTAEEMQNRFDGSVTATRVRQAMATGDINALESELRQMDDLLPTESLQLVQGQDQMPRIQIVSMFDPENVASLEPEEIVSDIDAETEAELAILDAQDGIVPPQDIAKVLSSKLNQLYADGGRSPIIPALESELGKINQQLESQAQEAGEPTEFKTPEQQRQGGISAKFMPERPAEQERIVSATYTDPEVVQKSLAEANARKKSALEAFNIKANEESFDSPEATRLYEEYDAIRKEVRDLEFQVRNPGATKLTLDQRDKYLSDLESLNEGVPTQIVEGLFGPRDTGRRWKKGRKIADSNALGDKFEAELTGGVLFRGVTKEDWERIQKQGYIDTDGRGVISPEEEINLATSVVTAETYIPHGKQGVVLAIDPAGLDLFMIGADDYLRASGRIPIDNVVKVSGPIGKDSETGTPFIPSETFTEMEPTIGEKPQSSEIIGADTIKPVDIETSAKPATDAVIKPYSNALVSSAGLINFLPAYHGTPYDVDKFKLANIGTGEGAQAYGWGLYFAQARKVAQEYKEKLTDWNSPGTYEWKGMSLRSDDYKNPIRHAISLVYHQGINQAKQIGKTLQKDSEKGEPYTIEQGGLEYAKKFNDALSQIKSKKEITFEQGNLYKVDLDVKNEDLLDWDKPLSEQPESVRDALTALINERTPKEIADVFLNNAEAKGGSLYALISDSFGESAQGTPEKRASEALLAAGIPGIRYLDGTSRKQGEGTHNYVVFDENLIKILDKNDKPVEEDLPKQAPLGGLQFMPSRKEKPAKKELEKEYITIDAGDSETVPVLQEIRNGKPLTDPKGDAKFAQQKYDLLSSPFIDNYSENNPEDTTKPNYKELAYDVSGVAQKKINSAIDSGAVDAAANIMVNKTNEAMKNADIAAGSGWYSRMRENLLNALGVEGRELLSQLLGATSAKTPVNENFLQAMDGYEGIKSGRYDSNRKAYLEMINAEKKNELNDLIDNRNYIAVIKNKISTLNKAAKKVTGKKQKEIESESKKLKELIAIKPEDRTKKNRFSIVINASGLMPLRSNGKKFNANSMAVMKVIAGTWLDNRKAPKTPNFAGNLSGRTVQATIDVWAARFLRQILHEGFGKPWRIQPKSETGVSNEDFALGQVIMQRAAKKLGMNPDDLQAILWFAEKHNWDNNGWTGAEGAEKSSFDEIFSVFFPKGKKPLTFSEASEVLKSQKNKDESIDQKEDEETYEDTDEE